MESLLSVVVVVYDMIRELPRTLRTLAPESQRGVGRDNYEIVVVDNGSPHPLDEVVLAAFPGRLRVNSGGACLALTRACRQHRSRHGGGRHRGLDHRRCPHGITGPPC